MAWQGFVIRVARPGAQHRPGRASDKKPRHADSISVAAPQIYIEPEEVIHRFRRFSQIDESLVACLVCDNLCNPWMNPFANQINETKPIMSTVRESLMELAARLPDECTWDDVMYQIYMRQKIEAGLTDVAEGRTVDHEEVFEELAHSPFS